MKLVSLLGIAMIACYHPAHTQVDPMRGPVTLSVNEPVLEGARPRLLVALATVGKYGCLQVMATHVRQQLDTVAIGLNGLVPEDTCPAAVGPASAYFQLDLAPGTYVLAVSRDDRADRLRLVVSDTRLRLRPLGRLAFIEPDTTPFSRPADKTFLLSCGTANVPELCTDIRDWITRQPGITHLPLAAGERIGFQRYGGYGYNDNQLFAYATDAALQPITRCMQFLADTLKEVVGAGVTLQTADGRVLRAWSIRSYNERHQATPHKVSGSKECPDA